MLREIRPNDRTAKRFRACAGRTNVLNKELFNQYKLLYPKSELDFKQFKLIIKTAGEVILDILLTHRDGFKFPYMLGFMFVGSFKPKTKPIDYRKSLDLGYEVKHQNYDTDGLACKLFYSNYNKYKIVNRQLWKFTAHRSIKNAISKNYKKNYKFYKQINHGDNAWKKPIS